MDIQYNIQGSAGSTEMLSSASQEDSNSSMTPGKRAFRPGNSELKMQDSDLEFTSYDVGRWNTCSSTISTA